MFELGLVPAISIPTKVNDDNMVTKCSTPCFKNPYNPSRKIYWIICPSHQVPS